MAFSVGSDSGGEMSTINVVPLIDVLLVLLIIFMVTAPLMTHKIKVELPQATLENRPDKIPPAPPITVSVRDDGTFYWNDAPISRDLLESELAVQAQRVPQPALNIRGDKTTKFRVLREVMNLAQSQGIRRVGFVAEREQRGS